MYTLPQHTHTHNLRILSLKQKDTLLFPSQQRKRENSISATEEKRKKEVYSKILEMNPNISVIKTQIKGND